MKKILALLMALLLMLGTIPALAETDQYGYANVETALRMTASEKGIQSGTLEEGTKVLIEDELPDDGGAFTWYKIKVANGGETGYVKSEDVDLVIEKKPLAKNNKPTVQKGTPVTNEKDYPVLSASGIIVDGTTLLTQADIDRYQLQEAGANNDDVFAVKERLYRLGYMSDRSTSGKFTTGIPGFIKDFQKVNGLEMDGICSPELQARLFLPTALTKKGKVFMADDLSISKASVKTNKDGGSTITFTFKNSSGGKIDAFDFALLLYNTYGERFCLNESLTEEMTFWTMSEERTTLNKNQSMNMSIPFSGYYFAGALICFTGYHTTDGERVTFEDDQRHWFGCGKGVTAGYNDLIVTPLTDGEKERAAAWDLGASGSYVDADYAKEYSVREGWLINTLEPDSVADKAGLQAGDVVLGIGDTRIYGGASVARAKASMEPGDTETLLYWRNGSVYATTVARPGGAEST